MTTTEQQPGAVKHERSSAILVIMFALAISVLSVLFVSNQTASHETAAQETAKGKDVQNLAPTARVATAARTARVASVGRVARIAHAADAARSGMAIAGLTVAGSIMASSRYRRRSTTGDPDGPPEPPHSFFGWRVGWFDNLSRRLPATIAPCSPFIANISGDSAYLRAMVGPATLVLPSAGLILGILASRDVHQTLNAPSPVLFVAIMLLGVFDGAAGLLALLVMFVAALLAGSASLTETPVALLLLGTLWFGISQVVRKIRAFTRPSPDGPHQWWARAGDMIIGPALGGYLAASLTNVLPVTILSGSAAADRSLAIGLAVAVAILLRFGGEFLASHVFPHDLVTVHTDVLPSQRHGYRVASHLVELALVMLLFLQFVGPLWLGVPLLGLFALDLVIVEIAPKGSLPTWLYNLVPRQVGNILFISILAVSLESLIALFVESEILRICYLLLGITAIGVVQTWLSAFDGKAIEDSAGRKVGGAVLAVFAGMQLGGFLL